MTAEAAPSDQIRVGKSYMIWQAAKLAGVSTRTAREWLVGHDGPEGYAPPVFGEWASRSITSDAVLMLSFLELVELVIVGRFRRPPRPISLDRIRAAHKFARETWHVAYPFAS